MISIITCSNNTKNFVQFKSSIEKSVNVRFEVIRVDNTQNQYSICEAYNIGAKEAKYDYIVFAHEDILIKTENWGQLIIDIFKENEDIGLVGIAGSKYKSLSPSSWSNNDSSLDCINIIQHYPNENKKEIQKINPEPQSKLVEVKTLDGVFLCTTKNVWSTCKFDEKTFKGFHCYDIDFSLQISQKYKLFVTYEVLIEHFSPGNLSKDWILDSIKLSDKWKNKLPSHTKLDLDYIDLEWKMKKRFFSAMNIYGAKKSETIRTFFGYGYIKFFSLKRNFSFALQVFFSLYKKTIKLLVHTQK